MKNVLLFCTALLIGGLVTVSNLRADALIATTTWQPVNARLSAIRSSQISNSTQYRLRITRMAYGTTVQRFVALSEMTRNNMVDQMSISLVSSALDLYNVIGMGDDAEEQEEIQMHVTGGTVLDFRLRVEFSAAGTARLFLTSLVPGRPGAWGDWELSDNNVVLEELKTKITSATALSTSDAAGRH